MSTEYKQKNIWCAIYFLLNKTTETITGRIVEILTNTLENRVIVVIDVFQVLSSRHHIFGMPMLARHNDEITYIAIFSTVRNLLHFLQ